MNITRSITPINPIEFEKTYNFIESYPWLKEKISEYIELRNFCESEEQLELINDLISRFVFLTADEFSEKTKSLSETVLKRGIQPTDTVFIAVADDKESDGSQYFMYPFQSQFPNGWKNENFVGNIVQINGIREGFKNIFLIDDFIGSGTKIKSKYDYAFRILQERGYKYDVLEVLSIASMEFGLTYLAQNKISVTSILKLQKGISDYYGTISRDKLLIMDKLEEKLSHSEKSLCFPYGYNSAEALYCIKNMRIPNDVFPIFWWEKTKDGIRHTLFRRR